MSESLTVRLDGELASSLAEEAARTNRPRGEIVRQALAEHFKRRRRSALDALREHVGAVDGPRDLSTNKKHLRSMGRRG